MQHTLRSVIDSNACHTAALTLLIYMQ